MSVKYFSSNPPPTAKVALPKRDLLRAVKFGLRLRCPGCGQGKLFKRFLKVAHACDLCREELHHHRADDAPPYFTILIVGHVIVAAVLAVEVAYEPAMWVHMALWIPLTVVLSLALLAPIKGAIVALQWALYMHGFDPNGGDGYAARPQPD